MYIVWKSELNLVSPRKLIREILLALTAFWLPYCTTGINTAAGHGTVGCRSNLLPKKGKNTMKLQLKFWSEILEVILWKGDCELSYRHKHTATASSCSNFTNTVSTMICASEDVSQISSTKDTLQWSLREHSTTNPRHVFQSEQGFLMLPFVRWLV